jgi:hypothetical protein
MYTFKEMVPEKEMEHELNGNWWTGFIGLNVKLVQEDDDDDKQAERQSDSRCKYRRMSHKKAATSKKYLSKGLCRMDDKVKRIAREINRNVCSKEFISIWSRKKRAITASYVEENFKRQDYYVWKEFWYWTSAA